MGFVHYELIDRKQDPDSFFLNPDGTKDFERKLDFTNSYGILNPFFLVKEGVRHYYQYIAGCAIYDPAEQKKQGILPTLQNSLVQFVKDADISLDEDKGKVLIKWLDMHPFNTSSPNHDPEIHDKVFRKKDKTADIKRGVEQAKSEDKAMAIVGQLLGKEQRMKAVASLFEETRMLIDENEIYLALRIIAKETPQKFLESIASRDQEVLSVVLKAVQYGVITKDAKGFVYQDGETLIFETVSKEKAANQELTNFLMSAEGDTHYRQILVKIQQKEIELNQPET